MAIHRSFYTRVGKRWFDVVVSFISLLLLSPFLLAVGLAVRLTSPGPALFRQIRTGRFNRPFYILKFRTMNGSSNETGSLLTAAGDSRITWLGAVFRKSKIDELPQLLNVLAGDMSLVGPRPEVPKYTKAYSAAQQAVFEERPGITGPSIIFNEEELMAGRRDKESFYIAEILPAKLRIDLAYCEDVRFRSDLRILFLTLTRLFHRAERRVSSASSIEHLDPTSRANARQRP